MPAAVIFDCDGVLVDSEGISARVASAVLARFEVAMSPEEYQAAFTGAVAGSTREYLRARSGYVLPPAFEAAYATELSSFYERELAPNPGIVELIARLRDRGVATAVASNGSSATTAAALNATRLAASFTGRVFTADDVARGKPAPDLYLHVASRLGVAPGDCLVLEDTPVGITAAQAARMPVWGLAGTYPAHVLAGADRVFASVAEVASALHMDGRRIGSADSEGEGR
jgi:HAD superfamily hydrolase (TIGR01509 family)